MSTPYEQNAYLVVTGYVKSQIRLDELILPEELIQLVLLYYLLKIEHYMVFDKDNMGTDIEMVSDHKVRFNDITNMHKP